MTPPPPRPKLLTRRRLLTLAASTLASAAGLYAYATLIEPHWIELVSLPLPIHNLPTSLQNKTLIQLSDLHIGSVVDPDYLISALQRVSSLKPDIVVITGDFMSCYETEHLSSLPHILRHLTTPPLGAFAILGNHDYGRGWSRTHVANQTTSMLESLQIRVLRNQSAAIDGLQLVGLDDLWSPNFNPTPILSTIDWNAPALTLSHNPDAADRPELSVIRGHILSGHTHGGQCKPPFLPPPLLPVQNRLYTAGLIPLSLTRSLYINRALGHLRKARFLARPEITQFTLTRA